MNYLKLLSEEPMFWSRIGFCGDYGDPDENGRREPFYEEKDWSVSTREIHGFLDAGCKLYTSNMHNGWIGVEEYDYTAVDQTLEAICGLSPDLYYMPRIRFDAPRDWCMANPGELSLTEDGPKELSEIQRIFTESVDLKTYNQMRSGQTGYQGIHLNSFSSNKWLQDAAEALRRVVEHIENSKYGKQIAGYHLTFGMCGETAQWGSWHEDPKLWGDYSAVNAKAFYQYCMEYYGSKERTEEAFGIAPLSYDNILPSTSERCVQTQNLKTYFRAGEERAILYSRFVSDRTTDNICYLAKVAKELVPRKPIGFFYGYLMSKWPSEIGHLAIGKLLDSPYIDFLSSPKSYYRSGAGESGGSQTTSMSIAAKKIFLDELDNDTHIATAYQEEANHPADMEETRTIFWREVAKNLTWNNQNFWWMDLYGGWFCDDEIMGEIAALIDFNRKMREKERSSISEILLIIDENSLHYQTNDGYMMGERKPGMVNEIGAELRLCGAPVDEYRLSDLKDLDLSGYKMIVFANAFTVEDDIRQIIASIPENVLCIWNYAAGIRNQDYGLQHVEELTGMAVAVYEKDCSVSNGYGAKCSCPPIQILPKEGMTVLERYEDGAVKTARIRNSLLAAAPNLHAKEFHDFAKEQGCHMYTDPGCTIYADNRFVGVFVGKKPISGIDFPKDATNDERTYTDILSKRVFQKENDIEIAAKSALIFEM